MKVIVAADHNGFNAKHKVIKHLAKLGYDVSDVVGDNFNPEDDYPVITTRAINSLMQDDDIDTKVVLICGSGQGMVMAANRTKGVRAGLGWSRETAKSIRNDEDANVLALPARLYDKDEELGNNIVVDFLTTPYANAARYNRRKKELDNL